MFGSDDRAFLSRQRTRRARAAMSNDDSSSDAEVCLFFKTQESKAETSRSSKPRENDEEDAEISLFSKPLEVVEDAQPVVHRAPTTPTRPPRSRKRAADFVEESVVQPPTTAAEGEDVEESVVEEPPQTTAAEQQLPFMLMPMAKAQALLQKSRKWYPIGANVPRAVGAPRAFAPMPPHPASAAPASSATAAPASASASASSSRGEPVLQGAAPASSSRGVPSESSRSALSSCPDVLKLPIEWSQVLYFEDPTTHERKFDRKRSPIQLPHEDLEFCGYILDDGRSKVSAFFKKKGFKNQKGARLQRPPGGVNQEFFAQMQSMTEEEKRAYKRQNAHLYIPRSKRFGPNDCEI